MRCWLLLLPAALAVTSCTRNTVIVVAPQAQVPHADPACFRPADAPPITPTGPLLISRRLVPSPAAMQSRVPGCAGILFHLTEDGVPTDMHVLAESPPGYGYGDAALTALRDSRYQPQANISGWHYNEYTLTFGPAPAPAPRLPAYQPGPARPTYNS
jgi:hypothetical protein